MTALQGGMNQLSSVMTQGTLNVAPALQAPLPVSLVEVVVYGISDLSAMDGLKNNLQQLAPVQDIEVVELSPDKVILNINAQGGSTALQQAIADNVTSLVKTQTTDDQSIKSDALIYQWVL
jgi:predicted RecB family endonuclease